MAPSPSRRLERHRQLREEPGPEPGAAGRAPGGVFVVLGDTGDVDVGQHLDIIGSEIERLNRVVKTFLDFTRPVELNLSEIPLDRLVQEVADLATPQAAAAGIASAASNTFSSLPALAG